MCSRELLSLKLVSFGVFLLSCILVSFNLSPLPSMSHSERLVSVFGVLNLNITRVWFPGLLLDQRFQAISGLLYLLKSLSVPFLIYQFKFRRRLLFAVLFTDSKTRLYLLWPIFSKPRPFFIYFFSLFYFIFYILLRHLIQRLRATHTRSLLSEMVVREKGVKKYTLRWRIAWILGWKNQDPGCQGSRVSGVCPQNVPVLGEMLSESNWLIIKGTRIRTWKIWHRKHGGM